jgi:hypothetical protein
MSDIEPLPTVKRISRCYILSCRRAGRHRTTIMELQLLDAESVPMSPVKGFHPSASLHADTHKRNYQFMVGVVEVGTLEVLIV